MREEQTALFPFVGVIARLLSTVAYRGAIALFVPLPPGNGFPVIHRAVFTKRADRCLGNCSATFLPSPTGMFPCFARTRSPRVDLNDGWEGGAGNLRTFIGRDHLTDQRGWCEALGRGLFSHLTFRLPEIVMCTWKLGHIAVTRSYDA